MPSEQAPNQAINLSGNTPDGEVGSPSATTLPPGASDPSGIEILREIGVGAAGLVYEARDPSLRRRVAYKRLHTKMLADKYVVSHFLTEAQITAQLDHPNVVPIYSLSSGGTQGPTYTMKLIEGKTLRDQIKVIRSLLQANQPLLEDHSLAVRLEIFLKVCEAMAYAHSKGVIHRDLKPENIMIGKWGEVYVMDWGIARLIGERGTKTDQAHSEVHDPVDLAAPDDAQTAARTQLGALVGSVPYMSPEQARGETDTLDARSDQYALGVILFELCTMKRAVAGKTLYETLNKVVQAHVEAFVHFDEQTKIAPELRAIVRKATSADRGGRYPDVGALAEDVRRFLLGESISALPEGPMQRFFRFVNRHRGATLATLATFLLLLGGAIAATSIWSLRNQRAAAEARRTAAEERALSLKAAQAREQRLSRFLSAVGEGRNRLDAHFQGVEAQLYALSAAATQAITRARPGKVRVYTDLDFADEKKAPPDFKESPYYKRKISLEWPVLKIARGVKPKKLKGLIAQIAPLRSEFRELFFRSASQNHAGEKDAKKIWQLLGEKGAPVIWSFVGLEQGVMFAYPGKAGYPPEFDPRKRPWYALGQSKAGVAWGNPYVDALGAGLLLPSAMALRDESGRLLGVAGIECTFDYIIENLLSLPKVAGIRQTFLVDEKGRIVLSSTRRGERFAAGKLLGALNLSPFPVAQVESAIQKGASGSLEASFEGKKSLITYQRLLSLGWSFVVVADPEGV